MGTCLLSDMRTTSPLTHSLPPPQDLFMGQDKQGNTFVTSKFVQFKDGIDLPKLQNNVNV